jgi:hypothetical protein
MISRYVECKKMIIDTFPNLDSSSKRYKLVIVRNLNDTLLLSIASLCLTGVYLVVKDSTQIVTRCPKWVYHAGSPGNCWTQ